MTAYVALLRAVNVGGTGKLPMADLKKLCQRCGFTDVSTYIQSGNVVFRSESSAEEVKRALEAVLTKRMGKPAGVLLRKADEFQELLRAPPFADAPPNKVLIFFLDEAPKKNELRDVVTPGGEELSLRGREVFIHFPDGQGKSKLKLPFQKTATARNLNTARKLLDRVQALA
jgi:uncharacterized protein (DUF1697 family)